MLLTVLTAVLNFWCTGDNNLYSVTGEYAFMSIVWMGRQHMHSDNGGIVSYNWQ